MSSAYLEDHGGPAYKHDCTECRFVGHDYPQRGEPPVNVVDMYVCRTSVIRRYSSKPSDYGSIPVNLDPMPERYRRCIVSASNA